jgi:hypothetical protein
MNPRTSLTPPPAGLSTAAPRATAPRRARTHPLALLLTLALLFTLLNAFKPLVIDDTTYRAYAAHIAAHPLDPYGFLIMMDVQRPLPAQAVLAPPVLPYWWALGLRLFGEQPLLWKLWLLPFSLLFVGSLYALFRRFARGLEIPLLVMTVLSPTFLPSLNLMLDVPAMALSLCAVALLLRACDRRSVGLATAAGVVAGLAMQTKYTALLAPPVMLLGAIFFRRFSLGLLAALLAGLVFAWWEGFITLRYGGSHFLLHLHRQPGSLESKTELILPLLLILGGVAAVGGLLGLAAVGLPRWVIAAAGTLVGLGYALVACVPGRLEPEGLRPPSLGGFGLTELIFGSFGLLVGATALASAWRLCRPSRGRGPKGEAVLFLRGSRRSWFLILWLGLEVAGYFALTPFPAARRVMGVVVVATLLVGRLAALTCRSRPRRRLVWGVAAAGIVLGLAFYGIDLREALVEKEAAEAAARWVRREDPGARIWFTGSWGFQYYAGRAGMSRLILPYGPKWGPIAWPEESHLRRGEWLVLPDAHNLQQPLYGKKGDMEQATVLEIDDPLPLRMVSCFYGGAAPLQRKEGPRFSVTVYRVREDFIPTSAPGR